MSGNETPIPDSSVQEVATAAENEDFEEALRWMQWLGHVELPDPGRTEYPSIDTLQLDGDWEGWRGYIEQRLAYCPS